MKASEVVVSDQVREQMAAFINGVRAVRAANRAVRVTNENYVREDLPRFNVVFDEMIAARDALFAAIIEANP